MSTSQLLQIHTSCPSQRQTLSLPHYPCHALPQLTSLLFPLSLPRCIFSSLFLTQHSQLCGPRPLLSVYFLSHTFNSLSLPLFKSGKVRGGLMSPSCLCSAGSGQGILCLSLQADLASLEMNDQMTPETRQKASHAAALTAPSTSHPLRLPFLLPLPLSVCSSCLSPKRNQLSPCHPAASTGQPAALWHALPATVSSLFCSVFLLR